MPPRPVKQTKAYTNGWWIVQFVGNNIVGVTRCAEMPAIAQIPQFGNHGRKYSFKGYWWDNPPSPETLMRFFAHPQKPLIKGAKIDYRLELEHVK